MSDELRKFLEGNPILAKAVAEWRCYIPIPGPSAEENRLALLEKVAEAARKYSKWQERPSPAHDKMEQHFQDLRDANFEIKYALKALDASLDPNLGSVKALDADRDGGGAE